MTKPPPASIDIQVRILQLEQDLEAEREARARAETDSRAKSELLATISHEARTSIGAIFSMAELLLGTNLDDRQHHYAKTLMHSSRGLLTLFSEILDFSKLEAERFELEAERFELESVAFDFPELMLSVGTMLEMRASEKGLASNLELADGFPSQLVGDPVRIRQILDNLIDNAVKFTDQGSVSILAGYGHDGDALVLRFEVHDTGIGLTQQQIEHLLKPYEQADSSVAVKFGGTGLGLSIVRQLAHMMGGDLGVESSTEYGSIFWVTLRLSEAGVAAPDQAATPDPIVPPDHAAPPEHAPAQGLTVAPDPANTPSGPLSGHILIVEDNEINQMLIAAYLEQFGLSYETAANGEEALKMVQERHFDVVLMDIMMPVMDGLTATRHIRNLSGPEANIQIIALTAHAMQGDRETYLGAGMDGYVSKPVRATDLFCALTEHLKIEPQNFTSSA